MDAIKFHALFRQQGPIRYMMKGGSWGADPCLRISFVGRYLSFLRFMTVIGGNLWRFELYQRYEVLLKFYLAIPISYVGGVIKPDYICILYVSFCITNSFCIADKIKFISNKLNFVDKYFPSYS